jgi:hypothetical protein
MRTTAYTKNFRILIGFLLEGKPTVANASKPVNSGNFPITSITTLYMFANAGERERYT